MKKTITINIAGLVFYIEEEAYSKLANYLTIIGNKFNNLEERQEITEDINTKPKNENSSNDGDSRFKPGDILNFVRVRFPGHAKSYPFLVGKRKISYGQKVMAMSDRGMALGYINSFKKLIC